MHDIRLSFAFPSDFSLSTIRVNFHPDTNCFNERETDNLQNDRIKSNFRAVEGKVLTLFGSFLGILMGLIILSNLCYGCNVLFDSCGIPKQNSMVSTVIYLISPLIKLVRVRKDNPKIRNKKELSELGFSKNLKILKNSWRCSD